MPPEKKPSQDSSQTPPTHRTLPPPTTPVHSRCSAIAAATTLSPHPSQQSLRASLVGALGASHSGGVSDSDARNSADRRAAWDPYSNVFLFSERCGRKREFRKRLFDGLGKSPLVKHFSHRRIHLLPLMQLHKQNHGRKKRIGVSEQRRRFRFLLDRRCNTVLTNFI